MTSSAPIQAGSDLVLQARGPLASPIAPGLYCKHGPVEHSEHNKEEEESRCGEVRKKEGREPEGRK